MNNEQDISFSAAWLEGKLTDEQVNQLTPEQLKNYNLQLEYNKEHKGHESQHELMAIILLFALFASQFLILWWKKKHYKSYQTVSLAGLYFFPVLFGLYAGWSRFLIFWTLFSLLNGFVIYKATRQPLEAMTPRMVYKWYTVVYNVSFVIGLIGYCVILFVFFGLSELFGIGPGFIQVGVLLLSYGLYFGVLGRDFVEICQDRMAATIGYYSKDGLPNKYLGEGICAVCGYSTSQQPQGIESTRPVMFSDDPVHQLTCKHVFHEKCIRGWVLIGKKDICPYCKEKVDLKQFKKNPWDTQQQLYLNLLDGVRYLVVWQPIIFGAVQLAYYIFGLD
ncbi:ring finger protein 175-like protein [Cokeromyces recurvatus]|uniref:ring finger protein 175-like protein n=1 Tax=Cokeromyces recurvatus TaxID=90255 RepID=UPI00221F3F45|nr:ring finger protein 175-like protein [Cokeromyces recurvatus]KAI7899245.1 ring finger protein 175-like protein [Cokeromyces recurvatus]